MAGESEPVGFDPVGARIGTYEWDPARLELTWDDTLAEIFAADDPREGPFDVWLRRVHPEDQQRVIETFSRLRAAEDVYRLVLDNGSLRYVLSRATRVVDGKDGSPERVAGVMIDVTKAYESAGRIRQILEAISDGFYSLDQDYRFTYVNRAGEEILGVRAADILGREVWEAFPGAVGTAFESAFRHVMAAKEPRSFEAFYPEPLNGWYEVTVEATPDGLAVYFQDITQRRAREEEREALLRAERQARREVARQAARDSLTGLLNRAEITRQGEKLLAGGQDVTLLFMDLDRFKLVNDSLGHAAGDELLIHVAQRLTATMRGRDRCARLGGDEFVVVLVGPTTSEAETIASRILDHVREPFNVHDRRLNASISIGLAPSTPSATMDTLMRDADIALYRAKGAGRDRFAWYDTDVHTEIIENVALEADLRHGLQSGGLDVHYQPVYDLDTHAIVGAEALARWTDPVRGPVPPATFIPLAEDAGLISHIGEAVLVHAAHQASKRAHTGPFRFWVNVSPQQFRTPGVAESFLTIIETVDGTPADFGIEITESALNDQTAVQRELTTLADAGAGVAIDDFGTGYSSLARLQHLAIDTLKIDQSFIHDITTPQGRAAVTAIIQLAHALGLTTIAEGIETPEQLDIVRQLGSDQGAGHLLARPAPADQLASRPFIPPDRRH